MRSKLDILALSINDSLQSSGVSDGSGGYEYSATYSGIKSKDITGCWEVAAHTVDGEPWLDMYSARTFPGCRVRDLSCDALYEFHKTHCLKRVVVSCLVERPLPQQEQSSEFDSDTEDSTSTDDTMHIYTHEFRLTAVMTWDIIGDTLTARPILGYQYTCIDGNPAAVRELPPDIGDIHLTVELNQDELLLVDGTDKKVLRRTRL